MYNVGVIGMGNVGPNRHLPWLTLNSRTRLAAVSDLNEERARVHGQEADVPWYTDFEFMLDEEPIDAVHICTPPQTHANIGCTVLQYDIPVLIEKPVAMNVSEVQELMQVADETDTTVGVVYNRLFQTAVREAMHRVNSGEIGEIIGVSHTYARDNEPDQTMRGDWVFEMAGGGIGEGLPHQLYLPMAFVGQLSEISCVTMHKYGTYDVAFDGVHIEAIDDRNDALVSINRFSNTNTQDSLSIYGTDGSLRVDLLKQTVIKSNTQGGISADTLISENISEVSQLLTGLIDNAAGFFIRTAYRKLGREEGEQATPHFAVIDDFYTAISEGRQPMAGLEDAVDTQAMMEHVTKRAGEYAE
jgi:predicted dehydrogenase